MNSATRVLIGLGAAGGVGGAGYFLQSQLYTDNIESKLQVEGYQILKDENDKEWENILKSYSETVIKPDSKLKFGQFDGKTGGKEQLIKECKDALQKPVSDKDNYEKAKHWCIVPITLETILTKEGFKVLNTEKTNETDDQAWVSKLADHVKKEQKFENKKFSKVTDIPEQGDAPKDKKNIDAIKKECEKLNKKKHYELDFKDNTEKAKLWCATKNEKGK